MINREIMYWCGGKPECFGKIGCGLCGRGECYETTDIRYARNRFTLMNNKDYVKTHIIHVIASTYMEITEKVGDSDD